ncbi:MAG: elongation factor Ts [Deltaproteobacteria bacterium]|nr:elongation factor Ts [Deltaproteobacteria bacterium]
MEISAEKVKELRERSGAGIMDCKKALHETGGDLQEAIDYLRKQGIVKASKKTGRSAEEGLVGLSVSPDGSEASLVEVNCETDFVARTDQFQHFVKEVSNVVLKNGPADLNLLLSEKMNQESVEEDLKALIARLGENMVIRRFVKISAHLKDQERVGAYLHAGSKIGSLVRVRGDKVTEEVCRNISMHVAAMHPAYIHREMVPLSVIDKEREIINSSPELTGKPPAVLEKIVNGKLSRYYSDVCLIEQPYVKDTSGKKTVGQYLKEIDPKAEVLEMVRFQVGGPL